MKSKESTIQGVKSISPAIEKSYAISKLLRGATELMTGLIAFLGIGR
jgi:hypothetical protein